jgi:hypothetical protein
VRRFLLGAVATLATACAPALREPPSVDVLAGKEMPQEAGGAPALLESAAALWARRPDAAAVRQAETLFLQAARTDEADARGLIGAVRTKAWLVEHGTDLPTREADAVSAVHAAQWCVRRRPDLGACDFWLAIAVGLQAREVRPTAEAGMKTMVEALERAIAKDPSYERGGPDRVLALLLLRAPGWPLGPGDADAGLAHARAAVAIVPDYAPNVLALAEAFADLRERPAAREAYTRARGLAVAARDAGDPDAAEWVAEAERGLAASR